MHHIFHAIRFWTIGWGRAFVVTFSACLCVGSATAQEPYRLGQGDMIAVRIVAWDAIALEFVEYGALNGNYMVGSDGTVMVPLLGAVQAMGKSTTELSDELETQLHGRLGLVDPPSASIALVSYRPIYVLGAVQQPGSYEFSPNLTVQQALALAGGIDLVLDDSPDGLTAAIRAAGTLRELGIDLARQQVRAARLRAEMEGEDDFADPETPDYPGGAEAMAAITDHERSLFQGRREAHDRALAALEDSRVLLETEIAALEEKLTGHKRQVELLREQVNNMESLVERGVARATNFSDLQRQLIDLEGRELDTETAMFRARQSIAELERDRVNIEAARQLEVLRDLQAAEAEIERLTARRDTTRRLLVGAEALLAESDKTPDLRLAYRITREGAVDRETLEAGPETRLKPADVLEVEVLTVEERG